MAAQGRKVEYRNVRTNPDWLTEMLRLSKGAREVPVVLDGEAVTIGWQGRA